MGESSVFVVRVWLGTEAFRATARAVDDDQTRVFTEPQDLLRFLQAGPGTTAVDGNAGRSPAGTAPRVQRNER